MPSSVIIISHNLQWHHTTFQHDHYINSPITHTHDTLYFHCLFSFWLNGFSNLLRKICNSCSDAIKSMEFLQIDGRFSSLVFDLIDWFYLLKWSRWSPEKLRDYQAGDLTFQISEISLYNILIKYSVVD